MKRKERLYISALIRGRPHKYPKVRRLQTVGNLPTIFESVPYPVPLDALISLTGEEQVLTETFGVIDGVQPVSESSQSRKNKKKFRKIRTFFKKISCVRGVKD